MKNIFLLIIVLAMTALGCNKNDDIVNELNANQLKSSETNNGYTEQFYFYPSGGDEYGLPVICNDEEIDYLIGDGAGLKAHAIIHYKNGEFAWGKWLAKGTLTSQSTGETFKISEANKGQFDSNGKYYLTFHTNAIGDKGTHYIFSGKLLWAEEGGIDDGEFIVEKAMCVGKNKKSQ